MNEQEQPYQGTIFSLAALWSGVQRIFTKVRYYLDACRRLGYLNVLLYLWKLKIVQRIYISTIARRGVYFIGTLHIKHLPHPLYFRYGSSDLWVFSQIFIRDEYAKIPADHDIRSILDCGANIGYSSVYFLMKYPHAQIVAIEPDRQNYAMLLKNVAPYAHRVTCCQKAIWSHPVGLKLSEHQLGDAREWAIHVRECRPGEEADIQAVDIYSLMREYGKDSIDILKVDIEGSETMIFRDDYEKWLNNIGIVVIELHGEESRTMFFNALGSRDFAFSRSDELTIAIRRLHALG